MIKIVTDSTCYMPADIIARYDIRVVPLKVQFGEESYNEITGITNQDFYQRLKTSRDFPTTSQPSPAEFQAAYQQILGRHPGAEILTITLSSKLSGTYNSAMVAAQQVDRAAITVFDSLSTALGLGLMVIMAGEQAAAGSKLAPILTRLEQMRRDTMIVMAVDTLEYLKRGGRISPAAAFLGTLLNTKPLLAVVAGQVQPLDRVRTKQRALERLLQELERKLARPDQPVQVGVMHVSAEAEMEKMAAMVKERFNVTRFYTAELGPVIGAHVGPGTLGVGLCPDA